MHPPAAEEFEVRYVRPKEGRTLIVGSQVYEGREDRRRRYKDALGLDALYGPGVDIVHDFERPLPESLGKFAHVECMSVMEHAKKPWLVAENIEGAMEPGATIFLCAPFIWRVHAYPNDYWRFTKEAIRLLFSNIKFLALMYAGLRLADNFETKGRVMHRDGLPFLERTEVYGFGVRA